MSSKPKILILALLLVGAMAFLMARTVGGGQGQYYLEVEDYVAEPVEGRVRLSGFVAERTVERDDAGLAVRFALRGETDAATIPVVFDSRVSGGRIPDAFAEGSPVVIAGEMTDAGVFEARQVTAKCPSKYEAADPAGHPGDVPR
jgi:cytochrome c-type biogenesis protein CcmE